MTSSERVVIPESRALMDYDPPDTSSQSSPYSLAQLSRLTLPCTIPDDTECVILFPSQVEAVFNPSWLTANAASATGHILTPRYRIADADASGLGVFAEIPLERGDLIVCERPLIVYPQVVPIHRDLPPEHAYPELEDALAQLPSPRRAAFFELYNSHPHEPSRVKGIIDTNALHIGRLPGSPHQFAGVCKDISRINHSCSPNATYCLDLDTFRFEVRALFPIPAGSQVFISYIDPALPRSARHHALSDYGFICTCAYCSLTGALLTQSETRRGLIARADADHPARDTALERWARDPSVPDDYVNRVDRMYMDLFEAEQLYYEPVWEGFAARLCKAYCASEDAEGVRKWAELADMLNRAYTGEGRGWAAVANAPERTEWWGLRRVARESSVVQST